MRSRIVAFGGPQRWLRANVGLLSGAVARAWVAGIRDSAAAIAFYAFFAIFPLALAVLSAASFFVDSPEAQARLYSMVEQSFPANADLVRGNIEAVIRTRGPIGLAGIVVLLWTISAAFGAVSRTVDRTLGVGPRTVVRAKARQFLLAVIVSAVLVASVSLTSAAEVMAALGTPTGPLVTKLAGDATSFVLLFVMFAVIYRGAPSVHVEWRDVWPGALLAALITALGKSVFVTYVHRVSALDLVFGSLTSIAVLLLWLYVSAFALMLGVEYNVVRHEGKT